MTLDLESYKEWVKDEHGNPLRPKGEPDPNTVRMAVGAVMGVLSLIFIGLAINAWSDSQGFLVGLAGLSGHYVLEAFIFAALACSAAFIAVMSIRAAMAHKR